jgi:hypothetical protein
MAFEVKVPREEPLPKGPYPGVLQNVVLKDTRYGEKLMFEFGVPEYGAEVIGWAKPSSHPDSNCHRWSTTLNPEIKNKISWGPEDVEGRECLLELDVYTNSEGKKKNKVAGVLPAE